jgi:phenylalanyl-tRNA synthetase beta chain
VSFDGKTVATFGEVHPDVAESYGLGTRVYVAEIALDALYAVAEKRVIYKPLPRYPAVERDLALLCDDTLPVAQIEKIIRKAGGRFLESVTLLDVYKGAQIEAGKKSVAYSLTFRSAEGTLSDADIDPAIAKICKALQEKDCVLRS